jgi:hypothetical protein
MAQASGMGSKGQEFARLVQARGAGRDEKLNSRARRSIRSGVTRAQYWTLNAVSLLVAALIGFEIHSVHQLDAVTALVQRAQVPLIAAQQQAPQTQRLIERTAIGATRDPALKDLLAKYGISVTPGRDASTQAQASMSPDSP